MPEILVGKRIWETLATLNHFNLNIRHTFIEKYLKFSKVKFSENEENYPKLPHRPIYAVLLTVSKQKKKETIDLFFKFWTITQDINSIKRYILCLCSLIQACGTPGNLGFQIFSKLDCNLFLELIFRHHSLYITMPKHYLKHFFNIKQWRGYFFYFFKKI